MNALLVTQMFYFSIRTAPETKSGALQSAAFQFKIHTPRFKYPAKLTIIIHKDKIDEINLLDIESMGKGL